MLEYSSSDCLALLIVLGGSLVQGLLGIGFGLLAAPLLYLLDPSYVPGPILLLGLLPGAWLGLLLGACVLLATVTSYRWLEIRCNPRNLAFAGFCSGLMGTATSVGGPPMVLVYQTCERLSTRDELATFFLLTTPVSLLVLSYQDLLPADYLSTSCKLAPAVLAGYGIARCLDNSIDRHSPRQLMLLLSLVASCWLLVSNLWQLLS